MRETYAQIYTNTPAIEDLQCLSRSSDLLAAAMEFLEAGGDQHKGGINLVVVLLSM